MKILAIITGLKLALLAAFSIMQVSTVPVSVTFTPLHTYFISPTGNDTNNGTSAATPWLSPNHAGLVCGDVIIAATGTYNSANFDTHAAGTSKWGTVGGPCPSQSGGIDGMGGIYFVNLLCASYAQCTINATATPYAMYIDKSNWAVTGWNASSTHDGDGACLEAAPNASNASIAYIAFINNLTHNCTLAGVGAGGYFADATSAVDESAFVGNIAYNAATSASFCGSGLSINVPVNVNSLPGTHIFVEQNFLFGNINGPCSPNSNFVGDNSETTTASASVGASTISVSHAPTAFGVGWPITAQPAGTTNGAYDDSAIPTPNSGASSTTSPTLVSSVSGTTIGLSNNVASPGLTNGQNVFVGTSTDGNGIILDSWAVNPYTGQGVVRNNVMWGNGSTGFEQFCNGTCASGLKVYVDHNSTYGNLRDYKHDGSGAECYINQAGGIGVFSFTNNICQADVTQPTNSTTFAAWNGTSSGVGQSGTGQPIVAGIFGQTGLTITGNYFISAHPSSCPAFGTCDAGKNIAQYNGVDYSSGNTIGTSPGYANPTALPTPTTFSGCSGYSNSVDCMINGYGVYTKLTPSVATGKGYQPPSTVCASDALFPTYLKGMVYQEWTGSGVIEKVGLVSKPCGV